MDFAILEVCMSALCFRMEIVDSFFQRNDNISAFHREVTDMT